VRAYYDGKLVTLIGQFSRLSDTRFTLLRYKRNCCAADATPLKATLYADRKTKFNASPYAGQWVRVTGRLHFEGTQALIDLEPTEKQSVTDLIQVIDRPANPYLD
jgi:uncharacterized membrane protein YcgQ (UPF0703/DUF1980 family)